MYKRRKKITIGGFTHIRELEGGVLPPRVTRIKGDTILGAEEGEVATPIAPLGLEEARIASQELLEASQKERLERILVNPFKAELLVETMGMPGTRFSDWGQRVFSRLLHGAINEERSWRLRTKRYKKKLKRRLWQKKQVEKKKELLRAGPEGFQMWLRERGFERSLDWIEKRIYGQEIRLGRMRFKISDIDLKDLSIRVYEDKPEKFCILWQSKTNENRFIVLEERARDKRWLIKGYFNGKPYRFLKKIR